MSQSGIKFDPTELNQALVRLSVVSDRLPSELVNQKGYFIFGRAAKNMKVVEKQTITDELGANAAHALVKLKSGRFSRAKKNIRLFFGQGAGRDEDFPLAAAIIQARAKKSGRPSPWKGVDRETGAARMLEAIRVMFTGRQRSRGYFRRTFQIARQIYRQALKKPAKFQFSKLFSLSNVGTGEGDLISRRGKIADVSPAREGQPKATSTFWVKTTEHDQKDALDKYAAPVLQAAIDEEAGETFRHEAEEQYKASIKALGIKIS